MKAPKVALAIFLLVLLGTSLLRLADAAFIEPHNMAGLINTHLTVSDIDSDGMPDSIDNCPVLPNAAQENDIHPDTPEGDACDDPDADSVADIREVTCGSDPSGGSSVPERTDGAFSGADDDGDTEVDEQLPAGTGSFDCDGDGWKGDQEAVIYSELSTTDDQDPCGNNGWPAELTGDDNRLNIGDFNSFLFPLRGDGSFNKFGHSIPDPDDPNLARFDLDPNGAVNIGDLNAVNPGVLAPTSRPPMFGGQPAFFTNGGHCPWPP